MWKSKKALSAIPPFADVEFSGKKLPLTFFPFLLRLWRRVKLGTQIKFFAGNFLSLMIKMKKRRAAMTKMKHNYHHHCHHCHHHHPHHHHHSHHYHLMPSIKMKKSRAARTKTRQKRIQMAKAVRPVASEGVACWWGLSRRWCSTEKCQYILLQSWAERRRCEARRGDTPRRST